jgi:hypothetical protein
MKKIILAFASFTLLFALAACGSAAATSSATESSTSLSEEGQLLVGTLKLETTGLAVSSTQATQLLPLWETLQSLSTSGTAATEEVQAVVDQIKSTMSAQQVSSITAMKLTRQDLAAAITDNGAATSASSSASTTSSSSAQSLAGGLAGAPAGAPGGGNPPADMAPTGAGSAGMAQAVSTQAVAGQTSGTSNQIPAALINALVELLKKKAG